MSTIICAAVVAAVAYAAGRMSSNYTNNNINSSNISRWTEKCTEAQDKPTLQRIQNMLMTNLSRTLCISMKPENGCEFLFYDTRI